MPRKQKTDPNTLYVVIMLQTCSSRSSYVCGVFSTKEKAIDGIIEDLGYKRLEEFPICIEDFRELLCRNNGLDDDKDGLGYIDAYRIEEIILDK